MGCSGPYFGWVVRTSRRSRARSAARGPTAAPSRRSGAVRAGHGSGGARAEERSVGRAEQRRPWQAAAGRTAGLLRPRGTLEAGSPRWAPSRGWGAVAGACLGGTGCQGGSMSRGHTSLPRTPGRQCPRPAGPAVVRGAQPPAPCALQAWASCWCGSGRASPTCSSSRGTPTAWCPWPTPPTGSTS